MYNLKSLYEYINESKMFAPKIQAKLRDKYSDELRQLSLMGNSDAIEINIIRINNEHKGTGIGSKIMQEICDYADDSNKILHLSPTDEFGSSISKLKAFYKKFGFVINRGNNKDFRFKNTMIRYPKKQS